MQNQLFVDPELHASGIDMCSNGDVIINHRGNTIHIFDKQDIASVIDDCIERDKQILWKYWKCLGNLSYQMGFCESKNFDPCIGNLLFLSNLKRAFLLSRKFTQLSQVTKFITYLMNSDISLFNPKQIIKFNTLCAKIYALHLSILSNMYRMQLFASQEVSEKKAFYSPTPGPIYDSEIETRVYPYTPFQEDYLKDIEERRTKKNPRYLLEDEHLGPDYGFGILPIQSRKRKKLFEPGKGGELLSTETDPYLYSERAYQSPIPTMSTMIP
jgi:hypothetical protein